MISFIQLVRVTVQNVPTPTAEDIEANIRNLLAGPDPNAAVQNYLKGTLNNWYEAGIYRLNKGVKDPEVLKARIQTATEAKNSSETGYADAFVQKLIDGDEDRVKKVSAGYADFRLDILRPKRISNAGKEKCHIQIHIRYSI